MSGIDSFDAVIVRAKYACGARTDTELCTWIGMKTAAFFNRKSRASIPHKELMEAAFAHGISLDWLFYGEGEMGIPEPLTIDFSGVDSDDELDALPKSERYHPSPAVDLCMRSMFDTMRDPRSPEYIAGATAAVAARLEKEPMSLPYPLGTAQADAWFAGVAEVKQSDIAIEPTRLG